MRAFADQANSRVEGGQGRVESLRKIKDAGEIEQIRDAIRIAEEVFLDFRTQLRPEDTEKDLADTLKYSIRRAEGHVWRFPSIVAVGPHAPHLPHARRPESGCTRRPVLLVDWGAERAFFYKAT